MPHNFSYNEHIKINGALTMGNQVLIAIRHDIDRNNIPLFEEEYRLGLHDSERVPKHYNNADKIIISHYHHSSDHICLAVSNQLMVSVPAYLELFKDHRAGVENNAFKNMITGYRKYRYGSIVKARKKNEIEANDGVKVSLFGYLTDESHIMPENAFSLMVAAMDSLPGLVNGETVMSSWDSKLKPTPIYKIGTIDPNQMALVELYGNTFAATSVPANKIEPSEYFKERRDQIIEFDKKFLKSMGYEFTEKSKAHFI